MKIKNENERSKIEGESLERSLRIFEKIHDCRIALRLRDEALEREGGQHRVDDHHPHPGNSRSLRFHPGVNITEWGD